MKWFLYHTNVCAYLNPASIYSKDESGNLTDSLDTEYLYTTLAHEGYPGHLYQTVYENTENPLPVHRLLYFGGYTEAERKIVFSRS